MNKKQVLKFIGKARAEKLAALDVYCVANFGGRGVWCIDALSWEEWADSDNSHTFIYEGYDVTKSEMMDFFRDWIDELTEAA